MKIQPDHYKQLCDSVSEFLREHPAMPIEYQALSLSPKRLRWDAVRMAGIRFGDSVGMTRQDNDEDIDTALRAAFKEAGCAYGAHVNANDADPLVVTEANRVTPAGNLLATIEYCDPLSGAQATTTCVVSPDDGQVFTYSDIGRLVRQNIGGTVALIDIEGDAHNIEVNDDQIMVTNASDFVAAQSLYTVTTFDLVTTDPIDDDTDTCAEREDGRWEREAFTLNEIRGESRNLGFSDFNADCLYSTDPSGTREYYEKGVNRYHYMQIDAINGQQPTVEQMKMLADALNLSIDRALVQETKRKPSMGLSM